MQQQSLFDQEPGMEPDKETHVPCLSDNIMSVLDKITRNAERTNKMLQGLIDDIQKDWTEEEKMMINNPKEYQRLQAQKQEQQKEPDMPKELTIEAIDTLKNSTIENNVVKLPAGQLDRKIYLEVKNKLELIGGKWKGGKVQGFVFDMDPTDLLQQIASGEKRNLKKEFQFFATPEALANRLVDLADIHEDDSVLEPSAGQGAIIKAIHKVQPNIVVNCCEAMDVNKMFLDKIPNTKFLCADFLNLKHEFPDQYDVIVANPPFSKNQDITHILEMYSLLKPGGRLVSIASKHWQIAYGKKEQQFREWLDKLEADVIDVPAGEFKESGTQISTCIIVIDKK